MSHRRQRFRLIHNTFTPSRGSICTLASEDAAKKQISTLLAAGQRVYITTDSAKVTRELAEMVNGEGYKALAIYADEKREDQQAAFFISPTKSPSNSTLSSLRPVSPLAFRLINTIAAVIGIFKTEGQHSIDEYTQMLNRVRCSSSNPHMIMISAPNTATKGIMTTHSVATHPILSPLLRSIHAVSTLKNSKQQPIHP